MLLDGQDGEHVAGQKFLAVISQGMTSFGMMILKWILKK